MQKSLNNTDCIQYRMSKERCPDCKLEYKGHRKGEYSPNLKSIYERSGAAGVFVKVGYRCPNCNRFFDLDFSEKEQD